MKKLVILFLLLLFGGATNVIAQQYGNEWIVAGQRYFRIAIPKEGIYRIYKDSLDEAGITLGGVPPRRIQIIRRGREVTRFIPNENDGIFSDGEYIEFYAEPNSGIHDAELYNRSRFQSNPAVPLYQDTASYFLTWSLGQGTGKVMPEYGLNDVSSPIINTGSYTQTWLGKSQFSLGRGYLNSSNIHHSYFDLGEGWTGNASASAQSINFTNLDNIDPASQTANISITVNGRNGRPHITEIGIGTDQTASFILDSLRFSDYDFRTTTKTINSSFIRNNNFFVRFTPRAGTSGIPDFISPTFIALTYNRLLVAPEFNQDLTVTISPRQGNYLRALISNTSNNARAWDVTDPFNARALRNLSNFPGEYLLSADNVGAGVKVYYSATINNLGRRNIQRSAISNNYPLNANYIALYHQKLTAPSSGVNNPVKAYLDYRASINGGRYDTASFEIQRVYDQFNYGDKSPIAIKRLVDYLTDLGKPQFLFLIGKGLTPVIKYDPNNYGRDLIPAFGIPGSDIPYVAYQNDSGVVPIIPIGRLTAESSTDVITYLNKIVEHESLPYDQEWRKKGLFLSGGRTSSELRQFREFSNDYSGIFEGFNFGGKATLLNKQTNNIIEFIGIQDQLNEGVNQITIFGHSSNNGADVDIGTPKGNTGINNRGKYPLIMINGCRGGNIYDAAGSLNEDWILTPQKGAIAFIGNVDEAFPSLLNRYVGEFMKTMYADTAFFAQPVGVIQKEVIRKYLNFSSGVRMSTFDTILLEQFSLHADPALRMFKIDKADFKTSDNEVFIDDETVNVNSASFKLKIAVSNFGKAFDVPLIVGVTRTFPNGSRRVYGPFAFPPVLNKDTLEFTIEQGREPSGGLNTFEVKLNFFDSIPEMNLANNIGRLNYFMRESGIVALFPKKYAIEGNNTVQFVAQATNPNTPERDYLFEIDTTNAFNSRALIRRTVTGRNLARLTLSLPVINNQIWYWRVRFANPSTPTDTAFSRSSFTYIAGASEGWNQGSFTQLEEAQVVDLDRNFASRRFSFPIINANLNVTNVGSGGNLGLINVVLNGISIINGSGNNCVDIRQGSRIISMMLNRDNLRQYLYAYTGDITRPWLYSCGREPVAFNFFAESQNRNLLLSTGGADSYFHRLINTQLGNEDYVLFFNFNVLDYSLWSGSVMQQFASIGADTNQLRQLQNGEPFIVLGQKGAAPNSAFQVYPNRNSSTPALQQTLNLVANIQGTPTLGTITSTRIGPARNWQTLQYQFNNLNVAEDSIRIEVYGTTLSGTDTLLLTNASNNADLSFVDASRYPFIYLKAIISDDLRRTPAQLNFWRVNYVGVPEGIVVTNFQNASTSLPDVQEGQPISAIIGFENISNQSFTDSIAVAVNLQNINNNRRLTQQLKIKALAPNTRDTLRLLNIPSVGYAGENRLSIDFNPRQQPELYYTNNQIDYNFRVNPDRTNPTLDVAFDGVRIMDGDLISPNPLISVVMRDDNKFLLKQDTVGLNLLLTPPGASSLTQRITFADPRVRFIPATESEPLKVEFRPGNLENGIYRLEIQTQDATGNKTGNVNYAVRFEVINESRISNFFPYPNPFSTATRFVFTLTGSQVPDELKIQIMTISGKVIREITKAEFGAIRLGNNLSSFVWNGTDEYGDKLANGVYLYRVIATIDGKPIEQYSTSADNLFKNGIGKMYIMR